MCTESVYATFPLERQEMSARMLDIPVEIVQQQPFIKCTVLKILKRIQQISAIICSLYIFPSCTYFHV